MEKEILEDSKERLVQKKSFCLRKKLPFSAHAKPTDKEKPFLSTAKLQFSTAPKLTCSSACHCELAESPLFFETSQSCVYTAAPLSHRFKASPAIPGKPAILGTAGYMMTAGHFHRNLVSSGDLNQGRRTESSPPTWSPCSRPFAILPVSAVSDALKLATGNFLHVRACFCGTFCTPQKVPKNVPLQGASRFSKPRFSSPQWRLRTNPIKTFAASRLFRRLSAAMPLFLLPAATGRRPRRPEKPSFAELQKTVRFLILQ